MTKKQTKATSYQKPKIAAYEVLGKSMLCGSTAGTINDLTEDTTTLDGLFD